MAAQPGVEDTDMVGKYVLQLRKNVQKLRETDSKLKSHEVCCQKAKEWFLNRKLMTKRSIVEERTLLNLPEECKSDIQFSEILGLLSEIKKEEKRLLMLKHQLHAAQMQQEIGLLNDVLLNQSVLLQRTQPLSKCTSRSEHASPLAMWFAEINQSLKTNSSERCGDKFSETSTLFYNVHYSDGRSQPRDLLVEKIYKKKSKRDQRLKDLPKEELQFSTFHKGYCVHVTISQSPDNRQTEAETLDPSYRVDFDVHLNQVKELLQKFLLSRKSLEDFVRQHVWREIENLAA